MTRTNNHPQEPAERLGRHMSYPTTPIPQVVIPEHAERFPTEAQARARADELNAGIAAGRQAKIDDQQIHGACHDNMLSSWDYVQFHVQPEPVADGFRIRLAPR